MKQPNLKSRLISSVLVLVMLFTSLLGTTFAWFTDLAISGGNTITAGSLKVDLLHKAEDKWISIKKHPNHKIFDYDNWEPGYTRFETLKIANLGNLALQYKLSIEVDNAVTGANGENLADVIDVYVVDGENTSSSSWTYKGTLTQVMRNPSSFIGGQLLPADEVLDANAAASVAVGERIVSIALRMQESAGNKYMNLSVGNICVNLVATQWSYEEDSFTPDYDKDAIFPELNIGGVSVSVNTNNNVVSEAASVSGEGVEATIPAGVKVNDGVNKLNLSVTEKTQSDANLTLNDGEALRSLDVHMSGVSKNNTVPMLITIEKAMKVGLNIGNYTLYHVENSTSVAMTAVNSLAELDVHNEFFYDPATGNVTLAMATFSEVALVAEQPKWEGNRDYSWYTNAVAPIAEGEPDYVIANADQLAAFGAIVGGMDGQTRDSFSGKTVKLIADINLGDKESENNPDIIFYPIGYNSDDGKYEKTGVAINSSLKTFEGTFDGNGHTIANFYQNTWEMKGDHNWYSPEEQYYRDGMGLFGKIYGGTVKNLTVKNFSSDGEIATTGTIAAYADGATFENIAIFNCNPRVYNIGNGGIVGCVGWYAKEADLKTTFKNITVDNTNKISALWGSYDVACGGIVGQYYPTSGQSSAEYPVNGGIDLVNCHVAAQLDVYNDVCGNYQYYAYRYAGMIIGSIRENTTNEAGKTIPDMTGISASGCTVNYGDWNDYYYCEFESNGHPSYSGPNDYKFSRVPHSELEFTDSNGNGVVDAGERASVTGCKHNHTTAEDNQAIYLPFHQLFTGYGWGVSSIGLEKYSGIVTNLDITEGDQQESVEKFETKFTGDFLYRVGNQNAVSIGNLFAAKNGVTISNAGVWVTVEKIDENMNVGGTFTANTTDWTKGTIQFSGTGIVKITIQDYNFCTPTVLIVEVVDATNLTSATGTIDGGNFVLLCDVNTSTYVNYWNSTLYGNGFTYSLNGAPTAYNSKQGKGILITKNTTLDNLVIIGDVYTGYGAFSTNDHYNTAIDVTGDTTIQNCYISGCSAPVRARNNVTIINSTLYGGAVANLIIESGTATLENVTTANYDDNRDLVGMGIVIHSDATEAAKLVLNGTLTQYNFISESKVPSNSYAKNLHTAMFSSACSQYHFGTSPERYVNTGIISLTSTFDGTDITDNANTGYTGQSVSASNFDGYVYTQPNTSGSVNNNYNMDTDIHVATTQGAVAPNYSFDYTSKNYVAKTDGSNDYCYEENGKVNISMDDGDTFNWDTSILTIGKGITSYTVSMNGIDYTGKSIAFNTAGDYKVTYTYTDSNNYKLDENGNLTTYSATYTKTVNITVAVVEATTKHAEFTFGSSNTASTTVTIGNSTYVMPNVSGTSSTIGSTTVDGKTIYYPIVEIIMSDGKTSHTSGWYAYFPVFSGAVTITDYAENGTGDKMTPYNGSTTTKPDGLSVVGDPTQLFKYQSGSNAGSAPVVQNNKLVYSSAKIEAKRSEYNTVVQYSYTDNAGATYYYYIGYHAPKQSYTSCVTPDTLVTLANGTQKRIDEVTYADQLLVWNFYTGKYDVASASILMNHGASNVNVTTLNFSDGTSINTINGHGFFDVATNEFVLIDEFNAADYIGHSFVRQDGDGYSTVELVSYSVEEQYTEVWSILTSEYYNCVLEGMWTVTAAEVDNSPEWLMPYVVGEDMKYDEAMMQADIEEYGLYTYDDFAEYLTYEQFVALGLENFKVSVGKGYITWEEILYLISIHIG